MAEIQLKNLIKSYGDNEILHHIDGDIKDGEFIVVVGPSGCGKSTLLRMVAGLESVTSGDIYINKICVNELEPSKRDIAMVFQNYALYPHMSVRENMAYGLKIRKLPKDVINLRVEKAAAILEIGEYLDRKPRQLSGGQRQRVAMGRAIVREPSVFLFDEPLSNLDAKLRVQMRLEIKKLQRDLGVTAIYVTHDQVEAMTLGDRLMVLNGGYVEQYGTPIELYEKPTTMFVAGFIGSPAMNFVEMKHNADSHSLVLPDGALIKFKRKLNEDITISLGVRPEHFIEDAQGPFQIEVEAIEHLGANTLVHGKLNGSEKIWVASLGGIRNVTIGSQLTFNINPNHIHLFDSLTSKRID